MAVIDSLNTAKAGLAATLATVLANPKPSYTVGDESYSWGEYVGILTSALTTINSQINVENPFEEEIIGMT